jgi:predicted transcriptional regulator
MIKKELLPLQMECTMLFQANPSVLETIESLEERLGRKKEDIQHVIDVLLKQGIVEKSGNDPAPSFLYKKPAVNTESDLTSELEKL